MSVSSVRTTEAMDSFLPVQAARAVWWLPGSLARAYRPGINMKMVIVVTVYVAVGTVFYKSVGKKPCEQLEVHANLSAAELIHHSDNCHESWTVVDSIYFAMVTMSTGASALR